MSATFVQFVPSTVSPFTFQATIAGTQYTCAVLWSPYGQRYYIQVSDLSGNVLLYRPLIACGPQLVAAFSWANGTATAVAQAAHNVPIGSVVNVWISQTGLGFDGGFQALATGPLTLTYPLASNPLTNVAAPINGAINFNQNMIADVIKGGYLLFRYETQQFEFG
jgi:hypothetical protein